MIIVNEQEIKELITECDENIRNGNENTFSSYDEGVRDPLLWIYENEDRPCVGRED